MKTLVRLVSTFFGIGYLPVMPGTFGSLAGLAMAWWMPEQLLFFIILFSVLGFWTASQAQIVLNSKDPSSFVMDEVIGMMLAVLFLPHDFKWYAAAFFLFRVLDVVKPWPISWIQKSQRPSCILWDDVAAGVATCGILQAALGLSVFAATQ